MFSLNRYITLLLLSGLSLNPVFAATSSPLRSINKDALQSVLNKTAKDMNIPAAFVLLRTPKGDFTLTYGTTKLNASISPELNTHFRIASVTKTMTAAVIVLLAQEGKLSFQDPVAKFLPQVPNGNQITVADLLKMRSGLYNYTESPALAEMLDKQPDKTWTPSELLNIAFSQPAYFKPDAAYYYSNTNYLLLGMIAEKLDQKPLAQIFKARLFQPLGMKNTLLPEPESSTLPKPYAHGYQYGSSSYALEDKSYPIDMQKAAKEGSLQPVDYTFLNPSYALAAGGVISTAHDLAIWAQALVSGKVFNSDYQHKWMDSLQAQDKDKPQGQQYGYGIAKFNVGPNRIYFHGGENPGYNTFMGYDPDNRVTLIVWTNMDISIDSELTANTIMVKMLEQIYTASPYGK